MVLQKKTTQQQKAIAVAKDVIKRLKYLKLSMLSYISGPVPEFSKLKEEDFQNMISKKHIKEIEKNCFVCALGACILSKARLYNSIPFSKFASTYYVWVGREKAFSFLKDIFGRKNTSLIECAYSCVPNKGNLGTHEEKVKASKFGCLFPNEINRLKAIMNNVITNNGSFIV